MANATITEAEVRERERAAYLRGAVECHALYHGHDENPGVLWDEGCSARQQSAKARAESLYPKPPRVVGDPIVRGREYRVSTDGCVIWRRDVADEGWRVAYDEATPERVRLWADLLANPTEDA